MKKISTYRRSSVIPLRMAFVMWLLFTYQFYSGHDLGFLGIYPRHLLGLIGVLVSPLVHGDVNHIMSNTVPLILLGAVLFHFYPLIARVVFVNSYLATGLLVWLFGREFFHIGASGVIYSLAFFLMLFGLFRKDKKSLLISIIVVVVYGGLVYGLMPNDPQTSWESHVFGAGVGTSLAFVFRNRARVD
ncbi:rhomboid family intramembrane serine protease [Reichenbachiella agariperforans]|uniref:Membrane associated serine protease, rhomboid family n=1 Tax=Reichenbachiella agariperforans TaxID=156994 RepID=A0A1M6J5W5_REIAG|nr:rhomboid family intramembrane serine protease [Reichenbachiella agariperforans]SHJ42031.1 Membrane associated serine protease, rhomboid family [Reichenbachiella agariperforans]